MRLTRMASFMRSGSSLSPGVECRRRMGVLFTEHSMDVVFGQADRVAVLVRGQLLAQGTPQSIRDDARVQQAYLGTGLLLEKQK